MNLFIFLFSSEFLNILADELYIPYSDYKNPSINSIHGTGNRTLDIIYRENCAKLCGEKTYSDVHCCEGSTLEEEKCQSFKRCQEILDNFQRYVIGIALISYLILMFITMVIVFIAYYCFTKDKNYKCKNAYSSSIIVLFAATVIPIVILQFYCWYKIITIEQFFGAKFDKCVNIEKTMQSVDVINDIRPERRNNENENNENYNEKFNDFEGKPPLDKIDNIINNNQKSSQRSGQVMLEDNQLPNENYN